MKPLIFRSIFSGILVFALILLFQSCGTDDPVESPTAINFKGVVVAPDGTPMDNADVQLVNDQHNYSAKTTEKGEFSFNDVAFGDYVLTARKSSESSGFSQVQKNIRVSADSPIEQVELPKGVSLLPPKSVSANSVSLVWTSSDIQNFLEYKVYRHNTSGLDETTGTLVHVATSRNDTTFVDKDLSGDQTYFYRVFVRNTFGFYGGSNILEIETEVEQIVQNGNFENNLSQWEFFSPDPCAEIIEDATSPEGSKVLKIEMETDAQVNISSEIFQNISQSKFIGGKTYELSFWARNETITGSGLVYVYLVTNGDWNRWASIKLDQNAKNEWTQYSVEFIAPTSQTPFSIWAYGEPNVPWSQQNDKLKVLIDGISLHSKN